MDKTIKEMITDIKKASDREKLVVFIGAGVSVNSGYRLWDSLIGLLNEELKYSSKTSQFSTDEMLKIPQYYYNEDTERYCEIIKREYGKLPSQTNAIIDELLELKPVHIITTNFDLLIEKSLEENHVYGNTVHGSLGKYSIIRSDDDFVNAGKKNYLIKMHGDVKSLDSLVLKEEDYLQYSSSHTLIETFIKSLFINYTFLFIGYGLGDYNIKLIMSWVDGVLHNQRNCKYNNRFSYYFINSDSKPLNNYEKDYYRRKNIFVIESSEVPFNFSTSTYDKKAVLFEDARGNNLLRTCKYIKYGRSNDLAEIKNDLSVFDNLDCITTEELMFKLGTSSDYHYMCDNLLNYRKDLLSLQLKTIIDILSNNDNLTEADYFSSVFKKAGIDAIVFESNNESILELEDSCENINVLYISLIECNFRKLYEIGKTPCNDQRAMLQAGYVYSVLDDHEKAIQLFNSAMSQYNVSNDFFHLLICQQNICKVSIKEKQVWYILKNNLSEEDKHTYKTLYDYLNGSEEIYQETVKTFKELERKFNVNYHSISYDEKNMPFARLRYHIHQIQKYFILNNVYINGYSGSTHIIGNWLKALDLYSELLLMLHSSNMRMHREKKNYVRNVLKKEDLYILITHPDSGDLKYILKKYNVKQIAIFDGGSDYIISVLDNYVDAFEFERIVSFKFASNIKNILALIQVLFFNAKQYFSIFQSLTNLIIKIMTIHYENKDYYFTVFRDVTVEIVDCIFSIVRDRKDGVKRESFQSIIENVLLCFNNISKQNISNLGITMFTECGILMNFSIALEYYYKGTIPKNITNHFFETVRDRHPIMLKKFIIELFPILSESQKLKWREPVHANIAGIEPVFIRFGIINGVFEYNDEICAIFVSLCRQQIKENSQAKKINVSQKPLYCVLRLVEKDLIRDIEPYKEFIGYDDFFDFVCFPNNFDFTKYDTSWGSWLTLEKYRKPAFKIAYEIIKNKYEHAMKDGPSESEKSIYYRYFYVEDNLY
ncbi:SIR2 family protein [Clostridium tagluense]|uniref:SIR2 family protein n=2 Tax=Clostridium tagluense TaxID=360422 RepID=UPI001CF4BE18|nr:SIR2 family protein [Clostridium tagluense]MCB2312181.1 SIR2 family protein [Clostridium tagluense]MCB2316768.1 SIR2 family protein [Clostridium tagluense]MCB2326637.1 SIR2 family protein [Clostridium tagluense]MCB2331360.1 SIR2 family protein [Clostridium tagluense]MCB2336169.1 SIR2 family protein [Clostridium tagluense]